VSALVKEISEHEASITTMEMSMQHAKDELSIVYHEMAESSDKPAAVAAFNTPASRRSSIASSSAQESTTSVPFAVFGSGTTSRPRTPDSDEFNADDDDDDDDIDDDNSAAVPNSKRKNNQKGV
jgi:hypothetical protein